MNNAKSYTKTIDELKQFLSENDELKNLLEKSLASAKALGEARLDSDLFEALEWPDNKEKYFKYLENFSQWTPDPSSDKAWTKPGTNENQEVYDRLCHFYWLINQEVKPDGSTLQDNEWFSDWLISFAKAWGSFLNSTDSFDENILESFIKNSPEYAVEDSMINGQPNAPSGWLTFNQFFARELNPGLRPIASPDNNQVITSPADCTYRQKYSIEADSTIPKITLKKTHSVASIQELLKDSPYQDAFANGHFVHYFLGPYSYHRFHTPVSGLLKECRNLTEDDGKVFLDVEVKNGQFNAPDSSKGGYEFNQARGLAILDTKESAFGDVGLVAVIPVGMAQVSSVNMKAMVGNNLQKGDELGYFLFGGSDIIVLLQEGTNPDIYTGKQYRHYGTRIATCHNQ